MLPSFTVAVDNLVVPSVSAIVPLPYESTVIVTVKGTAVRGAVPSAMSTVQVPEKVALPVPLAEPLLAFPSTMMFCGWPRAEVPSSVLSNSPVADVSPGISTPTPNLKPLRGTPLYAVPLGKTPLAAAVTVTSAGARAAAGEGSGAVAAMRIAATQQANLFIVYPPCRARVHTEVLLSPHPG